MQAPEASMFTENGSYYQEPTTENDAQSIVIVPEVKVTISLIICFIGLIGNLSVIFVITVLKEYLTSVTHWYVLQLAVADLLFLLMIPFSVSEELNDGWIYPEWFCKMSETIRMLNYYASILFLTLMSMDRYIAVCHAFSSRFKRLREMKTALAITIIIWIVALLLCIPIILNTFKVGVKPNCGCSIHFTRPEMSQQRLEEICLEESGTEEQFQNCINIFTPFSQSGEEMFCRDRSDFYGDNSSDEVDYDDYDDSYEYEGSVNDVEGYDSEAVSPHCHYREAASGWFTLIWFNFVAMFIIPFCIMTICYGLIMHRVSSSVEHATAINTANLMASDQQQRQKRVAKSERDRLRATAMCAVLVVNFLLCWIIFHATHVAKIVGITTLEEKACKILSLVGRYLAFVNSALNPYLYNFMGGGFVSRFRRAVCLFKLGKSGSSKYFAVRFSKFPGKQQDSRSIQETTIPKVIKNTEVARVSSSDHLSLLELHNGHHEMQALNPDVDNDTLLKQTQINDAEGKE